MRYRYATSIFLLLFITLNAFVIHNVQGSDQGSNKNLVQSSNDFQYELKLAKDYIRVLRYYYFFLSIIYDIVYTSNCISRSFGIGFRVHIFQKLSEINYYRNYFAEYITNYGGNATFLGEIDEFPKSRAPFLNVCSQIKYIDASELYSIEQMVMSDHLEALTRLKRYIYSDIGVLSNSYLLLNRRRETIFIINKAIEMISLSRKQIVETKESSKNPGSIYVLSKIPQKLRVIKMYKDLLKVRIGNVVKLRHYTKLNKEELFKVLEKMENNNEILPRH
ncbi:hypothetical protein OIY81_593 [Cryptosporidium canis]|nr:hypothetical protein OIY81_593 [Cryptosporidium canis]